MIIRIKDITGGVYKFYPDVVLENRTQIILRFKDKSEDIIMKDNIIYVNKEIDKSDPIYIDTDSVKYEKAKENLGSVYGSCQQPDSHTIKRRTASERKAYIDGFEACAECIEKYLTDEGKQKLDYFLRGLKGVPKIEDGESEET